MSATVYRVFDAEGCLLYVGFTLNPWRRFYVHDTHTNWWPEVASFTVAHFDDAPAARRAEAEAIQTEHPKYNVAHQRPDGHRILRLERMRHGLGLTPEEVAAQTVGVSARTIRRIEAGQGDPHYATLRALNAFFGTSGFELIEPADAEVTA